MCNLYSITTNQAAIINLFRVINRYVGNLAPVLGVFPDYPAPVVRNTEAGSEMVLMRWGMPRHRAWAACRSFMRGTDKEESGGLNASRAGSMLPPLSDRLHVSWRGLC